MYYACDCDHCGSVVAFPISGLFGYYCNDNCLGIAEGSAEKRRVKQARQEELANTHVELGQFLFA